MLTSGIGFLVDNDNASFGAIRPNDGCLAFTSSIAVTTGQTPTLLPAPLTFGTTSGFNTPPDVFNGDVFVSNGNNTALSGPARAGPVPEPLTQAAAGAGLVGVVTLRRRRAARGWASARLPAGSLPASP